MTQASPRRHLKIDHFQFATELSQQIEENVGYIQVRQALATFANNVIHRTTRQYFNGHVINDYHYKKRDVDMTVDIIKKIMSRRYETLDDLEGYLTKIETSMVEIMNAEQANDNAYRLSLLSMVCLVLIPAIFIHPAYFFLNAVGFFGIRFIYSKLMKRKVDVIIKKLVYNPEIEKLIPESK